MPLLVMWLNWKVMPRIISFKICYSVLFVVDVNVYAIISTYSVTLAICIEYYGVCISFLKQPVLVVPWHKLPFQQWSTIWLKI